MLLTLQDAGGVLWASPAEVASLTPAYPNRWRVVLRDGRLAYGLQAPGAGPWVMLGQSLVAPVWMRQLGDSWQDPAGFLLGQGPLPQPPDWQPDPETNLEVRYLQRVPHQKPLWITETGAQPCDLTWKQALAAHPELVAISGKHAINRHRLRRLTQKAALGGEVTLDCGTQLRVSDSYFMAGLCQSLNLSNGNEIDDTLPRQLFTLREYPFELATQSAQTLQALFDDAMILAANLIWQTLHYNRQGIPHNHGRDFPTYLAYLHSTLTRFGRPLTPSGYEYLLQRLTLDHLFTYQQLGLSYCETHHIGQRHPEIVLVATSLKPLRQTALDLAQQSGISLYITGQTSKEYLRRECFLRALHQATSQPVWFLAWVDFHPRAWNRLQHLLTQAEALQLQLLPQVGYLALPQAFSQAELKALSRPIRDRGVAQWLRESGGIEGQPLALTARSLWPPQRVARRLHQLLQQKPQAQPPLPAPPADNRLLRLALEDNQGIRFVPLDQIAALSPTFPNRWRADLADGSIAYHPGPLPQGPWMALETSWVRPQLLVRQGQHWVTPAGFLLPYQPLTPAPPLPQTPQALPGLPCAAHHIVSLHRHQGKVFWRTDRGEFPSATPLAEAARQHPALLAVSDHCYINRHRLERLRPDARSLRMDNGEEIRFARTHLSRAMLKSLGVTPSIHLEPYNPDLFRFWLRDFPYELAYAPGAELRRQFATPAELMANFIHQSHLKGYTYADSYRGYYYFPLQPALERAGFCIPQRSPEEERQYRNYLDMLHRFVFEYRFFTFARFGFVDNQSHQRSLGRLHPQVILVVEKDGEPEKYARRLAQSLGITVVILGGSPSLLATEYLAQLLPAIPLHIITYVDFDDCGWAIAQAFVNQLEFYGHRCASLRHLILPLCFSPEELRLFARVIPLTNPVVETRVHNWLQRSGGIDGQPKGIRLDHLQPYERFEKRFKEVYPC